MNNQEKDRIECAIRHIESSLDVDQWAREIAVEAMEKQIPKKPNYKEEDRFVKELFAVYTYCPQCGYEINTDDMHCIQCGQAIDWTEGE